MSSYSHEKEFAMKILSLLAGAALAVSSALASAELAVSANDNKAVLVDGVTTPVADAAPDTVALIDLKAKPPRVVAEIEAAASVVGPPLSVAIAPDESIALVTAAMKIVDGKQVPDDKLQVIDLQSQPPAVIATLSAGAGAAGVSINRAGTLALVANRSEGTVSVFTISGRSVTAAGKIKLGDEKSGPSSIAISADGKTALVTRDGDSRVSVLSIDGGKVEYTKRDMYPGQRPYGIVICSPGDIAVVANIGAGQGDADTLSVIDMKAKPLRVIDTLTVGQTPEGIACSPDGQALAVTVMSGSNKPKNSPFYRARGKVVLLQVNGQKLKKVSEADVGNWSQGAAFSADGRTLLVQNMVQKEIQVFQLKGWRLHDTGQRIKLKAGPAGIRIADKP
jgi:DNA-binding beta-propeller fold protein YncE